MTGLEEDAEAELVGRCYTKARRAPLMTGTIRGGGGRSIRLPFGPYTVTQLAAIVIAFGLLILARPVWGGHGLLDVVVLLGVPFGAAFALRHLQVDGRNPAAAAASVVAMLAAPRGGRLHGRPYRVAPARWAAPCITLTGCPMAASGPGPDDGSEPMRQLPASAAGPDAGGPSVAPAPGMVVASGVQALLTRPRSAARKD